MNNMDALQINHIVKKFGTQCVLEDVNLIVPERGVFGLIGQNGAGKTTLMKLVLGFLKAGSGTLSVFGQPAGYGHRAANKMIGYLPDVPEFYGYLSAGEYLRIVGRASGLPPRAAAQRSDELLNRVKLDSGHKRIHQFSRGMRQRLGLAAALLNKPKLLICDEATSALDPEGRKDVLEMLEEAGQETAVLFSSHILSDVERICDQFALLHNGKIRFQGKTTDVRHRQGDAIRLVLFDKADAERFIHVLQDLEFVREARADGAVCTLRLVSSKENAAALIAAIGAANLAFRSFQPLERTLENVYLEMIR